MLNSFFNTSCKSILKLLAPKKSLVCMCVAGSNLAQSQVYIFLVG